MSFRELVGAIALGQTIALIVFNLGTVLVLRWRVKRMQQNRNRVVEEAIARLEALVDDDDPGEQVLGFAPENDTAFD